MGVTKMSEGTFGQADQILVCGLERGIRETCGRAHLFQTTVVCREPPGAPPTETDAAWHQASIEFEKKSVPLITVMSTGEPRMLEMTGGPSGLDVGRRVLK